MSVILQDLRFAVRVLLKRPASSGAVALTLALGIGACTLVFSLVYGLSFRPLSFDQDRQMAVILETSAQRGVDETSCSYENFIDWRKQSGVFEELAAYRFEGVNLAGMDGEPERARAIRASSSIFGLLGIKPVIGRAFTADDDRKAAGRVAVISAAFWQSRLNADRAIIGRYLTIHGEVYKVVGVVPSDVDRSRRILPALDVWLPLQRDYDRTVENAAGSDSVRDLTVMGRRKEGVTLAQAATELSAIAKRLEQTYPDSNLGWGVRVKTIQKARLGAGGELALKFLSLAVVFVLLIVCFNVANLLLAKAASRHREIALRVALGANRARLVRQLLTESAVLALTAGSLGALLALWGVQALFAWSAETRDIDPARHPIQVDGLALAFSLATALATVVIFGLFPALQTSHCDVNEVLKDKTGTTGKAGRRHRLGSALVAGQIAFAIVLVVSTSLVVQSLVSLRARDPGFDLHGLLAANISLPEANYPMEHQRSAFFERTLAEIGRLPEVIAVAASDSPPLSPVPSTTFCVEGRSADDLSYRPEAAVSTVTPDYWTTMKISLKAGRIFTGGDDADAPMVVVINEAMARRYLPDEDPIGQRLKFGNYDDSESQWRTVVGIVRDSRQWAQEFEVDPQVFVPYKQNPRSDMVIMVRTALQRPQTLTGALRESLRRIDQSQPLFDVRRMKEVYEIQFSSWHVFCSLLGVFCLVALILAAVGTYGAMSCMVSRRTHEIGVRIALGASTPDVLRLVIGRGAVLAASGLVLGIPSAVAVSQLLSSILYRVTATDVPTLIGVSMLLVAVALLACYIPARRATRVDPMVALRCE